MTLVIINIYIIHPVLTGTKWLSRWTSCSECQSAWNCYGLPHVIQNSFIPIYRTTIENIFSTSNGSSFSSLYLQAIHKKFKKCEEVLFSAWVTTAPWSCNIINVIDRYSACGRGSICSKITFQSFGTICTCYIIFGYQSGVSVWMLDGR